MKQKTYYVSDLTDRQWQIIRQRCRRGRKPICRRWVINAILYVVRTGCQWRMLPSDFRNWNTVYGIFGQWRNKEIWQKIHDALREKVRRTMKFKCYRVNVFWRVVFFTLFTAELHQLLLPLRTIGIMEFWMC